MSPAGSGVDVTSAADPARTIVAINQSTGVWRGAGGRSDMSEKSRMMPPWLWRSRGGLDDDGARQVPRRMNSQCQLNAVHRPIGMPTPIKVETSGASSLACAATMPAPIIGGIAASITLT